MELDSCRVAKLACLYLCVSLVSPHALLLLGASGIRKALRASPFITAPVFKRRWCWFCLQMQDLWSTLNSASSLSLRPQSQASSTDLNSVCLLGTCHFFINKMSSHSEHLCQRTFSATRLLSPECWRVNAGLKLNIQKTKITASRPITSWQIDGETMETVRDFIFLGSKITAGGDCSHEIKRCMLLGRKAMTNLDSRDITLPTKVHLVKVMVFPVVMYGCESWTIKKAEHQRINAFELWCWRRLLRVPGTARRFNQLILKGVSPEYSLKGLMLKLKLQYFGHLMRRTDSFKGP